MAGLGPAIHEIPNSQAVARGCPAQGWHERVKANARSGSEAGGNRMCAWLWDCYVTPMGLEFRLFGVLSIYRLRWHNVHNVHIVKGWFGVSWLKLGSHPWNTVVLGGGCRLRWTSVLIEKRWWPRFLAITPDDPETLTRDLKRNLA